MNAFESQLGHDFLRTIMLQNNELLDKLSALNHAMLGQYKVCETCMWRKNHTKCASCSTQATRYEYDEYMENQKTFTVSFLCMPDDNSEASDTRATKIFVDKIVASMARAMCRFDVLFCIKQHSEDAATDRACVAVLYQTKKSLKEAIAEERHIHAALANTLSNAGIKRFILAEAEDTLGSENNLLR